LVHGKGLENVLQALAINDFRGTFRIVGDGPMSEELLKMELSDGMNVEFFGWCNSVQIETIINGSDALIFSSECDEWGLAVVEAVNLGCPVLGSIRAGAVEELIVNREHGYLFDPSDPGTIVRAFAEFSELNDDALTQMRKNCLNLSAEKKLSAKNMARLFEETIRRAID
jgi:glycosyltransferase involved in cell wall biosynthesis